MKWNSVKDRLPEQPSFYLVVSDFVKWHFDDSAKCIQSVSYFKREDQWITFNYENFIVTHWMPLPKGPEDV